MRKTYILLFVAGVILLSCGEKSKPPQTKLALQLDSLIVQEHEANRFDGTLVVGSMDSIFYEKAIGVADRVWDIPMRPDHRFDICSLNKSFIAALVMQAVEEGKLSLQDSLVHLLSKYKYSGQFSGKITIHQMLSHTSGLPDYDAVNPELSENSFRRFKRLHFTNAQYVDFISEVPPVNQPGKQFYYSNFSYHLLAIILEDIYQKPFAELLQQKICEPLKLDHTFNSISNREVYPQMAEGYNYDTQTKAWNRNQFIDLTLGRRIFSTSQDLYKWGRAMSDPSFLTKASKDAMLTNHLTTIDPNISYGYGWVVFDGARSYQMGDLGIDRKYIIHGGSTEGFKSMLINIENGQYIIAFLANTGDQTNEMQLARKIVNLLIENEN